jgi:hypothetical protein
MKKAAAFGWRGILLLIAIGLVSGCGPHSDRLAITGKVTLNGEPLDGGSIQFTSLGEKKMNGGAMVNGGAYKIAQEKGLLPGKYHVEINAPDNAAKPIVYRSSPDSPGVVTQPDKVPPEYNINSKKTIEVTADGANNFDFDIQGKPSK